MFIISITSSKKKSTLVLYKNVFCIILFICTSLLCQYKVKKKFENRSIFKKSRVPSIWINLGKWNMFTSQDAFPFTFIYPVLVIIITEVHTPLCSQFSNSNINLHINEDCKRIHFCSLKNTYINLSDIKLWKTVTCRKLWVSMLSSLSQIVFINSGPGWYFAKKKVVSGVKCAWEKCALPTFWRFTLYLRTVTLKVLKSPTTMFFNPLSPYLFGHGTRLGQNTFCHLEYWITWSTIHEILIQGPKSFPISSYFLSIFLPLSKYQIALILWSV